MKKIILLVIVLGLIGGGLFYWRQNQTDVNELNKTLPEGVRVEKSLFGFGNRYKVVNQIDDYEFKLPEEWGGIEEITYIPEREEKGFRGTSINIEGLEGYDNSMGIDQFKVGENQNLIDWSKNMFNVVGLTGEFTTETVKSFEVAKTQENVHLGGMYMYFFKKDDAIYTITNGSEEFIRDIISSGKW